MLVPKGVRRLDGLDAMIVSLYAGGVTVRDIAQQLACNATLTSIWSNTSGVVLDTGSGHRWATANQRRALEAMYATCAIAACD
jgi:putative transposase